MNRYSTKALRANNLNNFSKSIKTLQKPRESVMQDRGPLLICVNLEAKAIENTMFRTTAWTGSHMQMTLMSIPVGGEIPREIHEENDQMLLVVRGECEVMVGDENSPELLEKALSGYGIIIPAGKYHQVKNTADSVMQIKERKKPRIFRAVRGRSHPIMSEMIGAAVRMPKVARKDIHIPTS